MHPSNDELIIEELDAARAGFLAWKRAPGKRDQSAQDYCRWHQTMEEHVDRLLAIAKDALRLPTTADGVRVVPGKSVVYFRELDGQVTQCRVAWDIDSGRWAVPYDDPNERFAVSSCYSTYPNAAAATLAAAGEGRDAE